MKRMYFIFSFFMLCTFLFNLPTSASAQEDEVRASLAASVSQRIGVDTDITIEYSRPGVKGRKIWGDLVPYGLEEGNQYSNGNPFPWRAGANENTTIEFTSDIMIEGKRLPKGKYGIHMIPAQGDWTIIFSKKNAEWGSYSYDQKNDALRVTVTAEQAPHQEWLVFRFEDLDGNSATAYVHWEKLKIPFSIRLSN